MLRALGFGFPFESKDGIFSVAMSPLDSITTKRPFAVMSPAKDSWLAEVICATNGSGVALGAGACAIECAPGKELSAATTQPNTIMQAKK